MLRKLTVIIPLLVTVASSVTAQTTSPPPPQADLEVKQLLLMMDRDRNGKVSRAEFMAFMAAEFDRLDVNKDGELDPVELAGLTVRPGKHPGGSGSK